MNPPGGDVAPLLLLVEYDVDAVTLFKLVFSKVEPSWRIITVSNGLEALRHIMSNPMPDLIVTDLEMPRMTGEELISWVRANVNEPRVPILVFSCRAEPELEQHLMSLGADEYICKFSPLNDLKNALRRHTYRVDREPAPQVASGKQNDPSLVQRHE